jgi:hypothetical protein
LVVSKPINLEMEFERGLVVSRQLVDTRRAAIRSLRQVEIYDRMQPIAPAQAVILKEFAFLVLDLPFVVLYVLMVTAHSPSRFHLMIHS